MAYEQIQKIENPIPSPNDEFGDQCVVDGFHLIVGVANVFQVSVYKRDINGIWQYQGDITPASAIDGLSMFGNYFTITTPANQVLDIYDKDVLSSSLQTFTEVADGSATFGNSVAIRENYIVVGDEAKDTNTGQIFIYEKTGNDTWTAYANNPITADITSSQDFFGSAVATNDESIIVGAKGDNSKTGAIYIFQKDAVTGLWEQTQKILASDGDTNDQFGESVSADGEYFVSGASLAESVVGEVNSGAAYIYKYGTSWNEVDKLIGVDETTYSGNHFGESVYINGDHIIVGSPAARANKGVADVFYKKRSWDHLKKIVGDDTALDDDFGTSVSVSGRFIVIGSPNNESATTGGSVYVYEDPPVRLRLAQEFEVDGQYIPSKASAYLKRVGKNTLDYWPIYNTTATIIDSTNFSTIDQVSVEESKTFNAEEFQKLKASDAASNDEFAYSVAVDGDYMVVGAYRESSNIGAAYIFYNNPDNPSDEWTEIQKLTADDGVTGDYFGVRVAISENYIVIGAYSADVEGKVSAGAAYVFHKDQGGTDNCY